MSNDDYIEALLREREGYALHGDDDRAGLVDAELKRVGYKAPGKAKPEKAVDKAPETAESDEGGLESLRAEAEKAGVKVDGRWGAEKLREEIAAAKKK